MNQLAKSVSLKQSIFKSLFLLSFASVLTFSIISFFIMKSVVERNNHVQNDIIATLFTEIISQDILVGAHYEVFKKCKNALSRESILAIEVKQLNGNPICNIKKERALNDTFIKKDVYFDLEEKEKAAVITIYFSQHALLKIFNLYSYLIVSLILILVLVVYTFSKRISKKISAPLKELNDSMAMNSFITKSRDGKLSQLEITEFNELQEKFRSLMTDIELYQFQLIEASSKEAVAKVATQAAHDIRSPLEMLKGIKEDIAPLPEESRRRIQMGINRIEEITFNLLKTHKQSSENVKGIKSEELLSLITSVVTEKNIEYRNNSVIEIKDKFDTKSYGLFSEIQRSSLKSIISNLINNGIESLDGSSGVIEISLSSENDKNDIKIVDNGPGIALESKSKIFNKGFTTKRTGNGLGLYNAKQELETIGGTITFESVIGKGTTFTISLPKSEMPATFVSSINAYKYERIIVLDDDPAFHEVWNKRLEGLESKIEHIHSVEEMLSKYQALHPKILLLSDFELMDKQYDGIDTILKLKHAENSILVTARSEEQAIQDRCLKAGIKLLPKSLVNYVKVVKELSESSLAQVEPSSSVVGGVSSEVILVDDDRLVRHNWANHFKKKEIPFRAFSSIDEFLVAASSISKKSKIYIDSNLGDGIVGEIESEKIFALGFLELYLATGYEKESIKKPAWIKEIYSKSPENIR